ncbi:MAG: Hpt domain-containing protein [Rhodobacteraceae bacterium]|nr:Hpt domain-containing protein [Paracoccaceae bacterium]MCW9041798.1 Hpt domain-containing protein [Pseudopelagicola sp.]
MSVPMSEELYEALKGIRESFLDDLVTHINEMENYCRYLDDPNNAMTAVAGLRGVVHKISGIAGSVGFPQLGDEAGRLDLAFGQILKAPYDPAKINEIRAPLEAFLDHLEDAFDEKLLPSGGGQPQT